MQVQKVQAAEDWLRRGRDCWQRGDLAQAAQCAQAALLQGAPPFAAQALLGDALLGQRMFEPALQAYAAALALQPDNKNLRFLCGETLFHLERYAEAVACLQDLDPAGNDALALEHAMTLGRAQHKLGLHLEAELNLLRAYMQWPDSKEAACNLSTFYTEQGQHAQAVQFLAPAVDRHPNAPRLHYLLGSALLQCGRRAEGVEQLQSTLTLDPHHMLAHQNLALTALLDGDLALGWRHYAWRSNRHTAEGAPTHWAPATPSLPADLTGRTVRIIGEQGIGDELFFMRYLPALRARGARLLYQVCNSKLEPLLPHLALPDLVDTPDSVADFSLWAGDLPCALGELGHPEPLHFRVNNLPTAAWLERSPQLREARMRLGITWRAGTAATPQAAGPHQWLSKAVPLDALMDVLESLPVDLVVLQRNPHPAELQYIEERIGAKRMLDASGHDKDLVDLLALLSLLDGLVGVSNTNVHLAAGLGKELHTLVPSPYEFRWGAHGSSPWFVGAGVYRQTDTSDWQVPLAQLQTALQERFQRH